MWVCASAYTTAQPLRLTHRLCAAEAFFVEIGSDRLQRGSLLLLEQLVAIPEVTTLFHPNDIANWGSHKNVKGNPYSLCQTFVFHRQVDLFCFFVHTLLLGTNLNPRSLRVLTSKLSTSQRPWPFSCTGDSAQHSATSRQDGHWVCSMGWASV